MPIKFQITQTEGDLPELPVERVWSGEDVARLRQGRGASVVSANPVAFEQGASGLGYAAAGLAHDLNNVLAPVITSMEMLRLHYTEDDNARRLLSLIERHVRQGPHLIEQILSLAQGMEGGYAPVQIAGMLGGLKKQIRDTFPKNIEVTFHIAADLWPVLGSLADLHEAALNLCVNAREAMPMGGKLDISAENVVLDDDCPFVTQGAIGLRYVLLTMQDTGAGISEEIQERIFEPGYSTKPGRAGQGLHRSSQIVETHHGQLLVNSQPLNGTAFKLFLPAAPGTMSGLSANHADLAHGHGEDILVVDDEEAIRLVTQQTFESFGYRVIPAANGADAISMYLQSGRKIALVFTDMNMPIMDGASTIHTLRGIDPSIKIIATSGLKGRKQMANASSAGANHFLPKPYTAADLLKLVQTTLHEPAARQA